MHLTSRGARRIAAVATIGLVSALGTLPAGAGSPSRTLTVTPTSLAAGGTITVSGPADCTESELSVEIPALELATFVDGSSSWSTPFTIPADTTPSTYLVEVTGNECPFADATFVVTAVAPTTTTTVAPTTTTAAPTTTTTASPAAAAAAVATPTFTG